MGVKFVVTKDRVNSQLSPAEYFSMADGDTTEAFKIMKKFMVDDADNFLSPEQADAEMRKTTMGNFWTEHYPAFISALRDAFVNPTNAGG
jgi:hypothetical protein